MIDDALIEKVADNIRSVGAEEETVRALRESWPDVHFTYCMDDDLGAMTPVREDEGFNIYLVSGKDHCVSFTSSKENATGLVIAYVEPEDA